jgi:hypothetical protein
MNTEKLNKIIQDATEVYRKGKPIDVSESKNPAVVETFDYEHTGGAPVNGFEKVDMVFVDVVVDKTKAEKYKKDLVEILNEYPQPERLKEGPSYIELSPNCGFGQEYGLRLMALGKIAGLWDLITPKTLGADDTTAKQMAGQGFLMISGYRPVEIE